MFSVNALVASGVSSAKIISPEMAVQTAVYNNYLRALDDVDSYTRNNIAKLAAANNAGGSNSVVDAVDFINVNRALVFYHENTDQYLAEEVFKDNNHQVAIDRFILKVKNDTDYSHGVYGQD
jgi:hypothetical protein